MNRRAIWSALAAALVAIAVLIHPPSRAYACSCMMMEPPAQARDKADIVFAGTVDAIGQAPAAENGQLAVTFNVSSSWKGPKAPQLTLRTSGSSASCGYEFAPGKEYLVYGYAQDGGFGTGLCTRTAPLDAAGDDLRALGAGELPPQTMPAPQAAGLPWPYLLGGVLLLGALAGGTALMIRRGRAA